MMRVLAFLVAVFALCATLAHAETAQRTGIVFLPHKGGAVGVLPGILHKAGFLVEAPAMNWYARTYEDTMPVIDRLVERLRKRGATHIVVGGHSLGANVALGYGARREGLAGVLAVAPGHVPSVGGWQAKNKRDYLRARKLVKAGKSDQPAKFRDSSQNRKFFRRTTPRIYVSWFDPLGPAVYRKNAANLKPGTALFWIVGRRDIMYSRGEHFAYNQAPPHPASRYETIDAGHRDTPEIGAAKIIEWLKSL